MTVHSADYWWVKGFLSSFQMSQWWLQLPPLFVYILLGLRHSVITVYTFHDILVKVAGSFALEFFFLLSKGRKETIKGIFLRPDTYGTWNKPSRIFFSLNVEWLTIEEKNTICSCLIDIIKEDYVFFFFLSLQKECVIQWALDSVLHDRLCPRYQDSGRFSRRVFWELDLWKLKTLGRWVRGKDQLYGDVYSIWTLNHTAQI